MQLAAAMTIHMEQTWLGVLPDYAMSLFCGVTCLCDVVLLYIVPGCSCLIHCLNFLDNHTSLRT